MNGVVFLYFQHHFLPRSEESYRCLSLFPYNQSRARSIFIKESVANLTRDCEDYYHNRLLSLN